MKEWQLIDNDPDLSSKLYASALFFSCYDFSWFVSLLFVAVHVH